MTVNAPEEEPAGTTNEIWVSEITVKDVTATELKLTAEVVSNPDPVTVTKLPTVADVGETLLMVGETDPV